MLNLSIVITCILYYITFCTSFLKESCNTGKWSRGFFLGGGFGYDVHVTWLQTVRSGCGWVTLWRRIARVIRIQTSSSKENDSRHSFKQIFNDTESDSLSLSLSPLPLLSAYLVRCVFDLLLLNKLSTHLICVRNIISSGTHQRFEPVSENRLFVPLNTLIRFYSAFYIMGHRFGFCFTA